MIVSFLAVFLHIGFFGCVLYSFFIPWVKTNVSIEATMFYRIQVPLEIGLTKCFSKICKDFEAMKLLSNPYDNSTESFPPIHIRPPINIGHPTIDEIHRIVRREIARIEQPFKRASYATVSSIIVSMILTVQSVAVMLYSYFIERRSIFYPYLQFVVLLSLLCACLGALAYILLTYQHVNGGEYLSGFWLVVSSSSVLVLVMMISSILADSHRLEYERIRDDNIELMRVSETHTFRPPSAPPLTV